MKKLLLLLALALPLSGCAIATIQTESVDGKVVKCDGSYASMFKDVDQISLSACGGRGSSAGSKVNTELLQAVLKAVVAMP